MVKNLEKYNSDSGPSLRNNFLTNSVVSIWDNVANEFAKFNTDVIQDFKDKKTNNSTKETLSIQ